MSRAAGTGIRAAAWIAVAAAMVSMGGCIFSIRTEESIAHGTAYSGSTTAKIKLSREEREELPCVQTTADLPTVRSEYASQLSQLGPTTSLTQFKGIFPDAKFVERRTGEHGDFDAYSVRVERKYRYRDESYGYMARDEKWFYFRDESFVKFGGPHEWPEMAKAGEGEKK